MKFLILITVLMSNLAMAADNDPRLIELGPTINLRKINLANTERYAFEMCNMGKCLPVGDPIGYSQKQLDSFHGRWQKLSSVALGAGEIVVVLGSALFGGVIGAGGVLGMSADVGFVIVPAGTVAIEGGAFAFLKNLQPGYHWSNANVKIELQES